MNRYEIYKALEEAEINNDLEVLKDVSGELRYSKATIEKIALIQNQIRDTNKSVVKINVASEYISPGLYPLFWSLPYIGNFDYKWVVITHSLNNKRLHDTLVRQGVNSHFCGEACKQKDNNSIPFQMYSTNNGTSDIDAGEILKRITEIMPVRMSDDYLNIFRSKLYEVFKNSIEHGKNDVGLFANGYFDKKNNKFTFTIYDFGIGIPENVRTYLNRKDMSCKEAIDWALNDGNTTLFNADYTRGAGFGILETFIKSNSGKILLCSEDCFCEITQKGRMYSNIKVPIIGTLFSMVVNADKRHIYS